MTEIGQNTERYSVTFPTNSRAVVVLDWGVGTHTGYRRRHNEDSYIAQSPIFAVADGMGGHSAGDVASKAVVTRLAEYIRTDLTDPAAIDEALLAATADISLAADYSELGVGTTVTGAALVAHGAQAYWSVFNVGDSRVYLFEGGKLSQITVDHSLVQELVDAGRISASEAERHPDSNIITRAVGFNADPITDYWLIPIRRGMRLLVCSDGLTKEVNNAGLAKLLGAGLSARESANRLVHAALAAGGRDNVTVVIVDVVESVGLDDGDSDVSAEALADGSSHIASPRD
ncbi:MAG: protein phosphatase [Homoserinimonas sp.]|nr:protein phosphatase [Homoserinimonas sp.]